MPELPEVETIRRDLAKVLIGKKIKSVDISLSKIVRNDDDEFVNIIQGAKFTAIERVGKLLIFKVSTKYYLLIHLKMTGQLIYKDKKIGVGGGHTQRALEGTLPGKHTHVTFAFNDGSKLFFNDLRRFGYLHLVEGAMKDIVRSKYGPEPTAKNFTSSYFHQLLKGKRSSIKAVLLNQKWIAGLGNIYVDEACFLAGVRPARTAGTLNKRQAEALWKSCRQVIAEGIKYRGTTFSNYLDGLGKRGGYSKKLKVFGRQGKACLRCKRGVITKMRVAGRGTHYCPLCQK
ncbi:MAG: bifunctional DNA-formamidopyrimidine glycosylase/DNA-(apurinic or apyrimidinic site) lyase [Candidatus Komeilibacteria bacterium]|nr:bifunctional DNA-formamidopyrimidine glycosylase/DNA-(apurinic or apyrimidinic site) lyase [Candidatus Komeilibacteria bacterium]